MNPLIPKAIWGANYGAGIYPDVGKSQDVMGQGFLKEYIPDGKNHRLYFPLYKKYLGMGEFLETIK
ncbi:MAG: hypothetical protein LBU57_03000 [Dysgonamonadaceae bacterium]|jgi:hypothetical protein|nr:hypothetical protein [Dysgonamonadaceae bacterium]